MPDLRKRAVREALTVRVDFNGAMAEGAGGFAGEVLDGLRARVEGVAAGLVGQRENGAAAFLGLPQDREVLTAVRTLADSLRGESDTLVVLGAGGAVLGARALVEALGDGSRTVFIADYVDPVAFGRLLDSLELSRTTFLVVSRLGDTPQTLAQFLLVRELLLRRLGGVDYTRRIVVVTDAEKGALRQIVHDEGFRSLALPARLPDHFSVLSAAGLLPAAFAGVRLDELLAGALAMDSRCQLPDLRANPAHLLAAVLYLAATVRGQSLVTLRPYGERLRPLIGWFAQLWAAGLGGTPREADGAAGAPVPLGRAAADPHSPLPGRGDPIPLFVRIEDHGRELPVASAYKDIESVAYLGGCGLGELLNLEQQCAELALVKRGCPVITISLPQLNPYTLGQILFLLEIATAVAAGLHQADPFAEARFDDVSRLIQGRLGREGLEDSAAEVDAYLAARRAEWILG